MRINTKWQASIKDENDFFVARVPGNLQCDYAAAHNYGDVNYGNNCLEYAWMEEKAWIYKTEFENISEKEKRLFFVSEGIDYECDIYINSKHILHHVGMMEKIEVDITDYLCEKNILEVSIEPPPKDPECKTVDRSQAAQCTKGTISYGWDCHPRIIPTGIWKETYFENRGDEFLSYIEPFYELNDDLTKAELRFETNLKEGVYITLFDPDGKIVYTGYDLNISLDNIRLWWCNGQGEAALYKYVAKTKENEVSGFIGFKKVELVMNEGAWNEPSDFPKTRSAAPITVKLNGRKIFVKGSNWVSPEIFYGNINYDTYHRLLILVKDANMNAIRCWGGKFADKKEFFDICDKYGIMVWQEFPLACNNYRGTKEYLEILEIEAISIVRAIRPHACHIMWCGGNELFNRWSGMTDQSLALRLLNKICYEEDRNKPFIMTSPLMGMGHGHYMFHDKNTGKTVYDIFHNAKGTAYPEFGVPSISSIEQLKKIIPPEDFEKIEPDTVWQTHHGFGAWDVGDHDTFLCFSQIDRVCGKQDSLEDYIECSQTLQGEGLKYIFEEARRQKPFCSMAMNWCFNEPWITAANLSIVSYPATPKKSYYCVKDALRPVLPSLRAYGFKYTAGDEFKGELWLLNDSDNEVETSIEAYLEIDGVKKHILTWNTEKTNKNTNLKGHTISFKIPKDTDGEFKVVLKSSVGESAYRFICFKKEEVKEAYTNLLNG